MALNPAATNLVSCTVCSWSRILDPLREYRGGHTHPETGAECHEMLRYEQVSPLPPEMVVLGEDTPRMSPMEVGNIEDPEERRKQDERNADLDARIAEARSHKNPAELLAAVGRGASKDSPVDAPE